MIIVNKMKLQKLKLRRYQSGTLIELRSAYWIHSVFENNPNLRSLFIENIPCNVGFSVANMFSDSKIKVIMRKLRTFGMFFNADYCPSDHIQLIEAVQSNLSENGYLTIIQLIRNFATDDFDDGLYNKFATFKKVEC
jgi:hypothetical protein